ncbi:MAG: hypothetical protein H6822_14630 [Planctomycetaceae bacterium]|nr:hypothetical protein [Planctomycetales bacterium]MCB9923416.1 hypothetical protein [Planctomycetaceae bacterium]
MINSISSAVADQTLQLHRRRDLHAEPVHFRGARYWSIKDPLSLRIYQLCDEELFILEQVDDASGYEDIKRRFESRFEPRKLDVQELQAFLGALHREGLVTSNAPGQAEQLLDRHKRAQRREKLQSLTNILAIRFRGINPEPVLQSLYPQVRWMFSRPAILTSLLFILAAFFSPVIYAKTFVERLPLLHTFLSFENVLLMAIVLAVCKILHELGHALACKHFGGQCHELGVMLLVFTPCLYCNVSDAWMIRSKWKRIAISAAGIYVELLLASACTFLWWFSQPGVFNSICLNVMFVCSVSTILFNGNPLLRYDGYFILADFVELPNLRQQSQLFFRHVASRCLGIETRETWTVQRRHRIWLVLYGIASGVYRWILVVGILLVIYRASEPYHLEGLALVFATFVVGGMLVTPIWGVIALLREPKLGSRGRLWRTTALTILLGSGVFLLGLLPVSRHVTAPVVIEPAEAARVHVTVPGTLKRFTAIGEKVSQGDVIAELVDSELERQLAQVRGERDVQKLYVEQLRKMSVLERGVARDGAGSQLVTAQETLAATQRRLDQMVTDHLRLKLVAPRTGTVLPNRSRQPIKTSEQLATWFGTPLDDRNLGCHLDTDVVVCLVGDATRLKGVAVVGQTDIERVAIGQPVQILVDELHTKTLTGTVDEVARLELAEPPPELIAKGLLPTNFASSSDTFYAVSVRLDSDEDSPLLWSSGQAKIAVQPLTFFQVIYKQVCNTFRIDL